MSSIIHRKVVLRFFSNKSMKTDRVVRREDVKVDWEFHIQSQAHGLLSDQGDRGGKSSQKDSSLFLPN